MTEEIKVRHCIKCKQNLPETNFLRAGTNFLPGKRAIICTPCLETMIAQDNLDEVDALCRHLDIPFDVNQWTKLYKTHKDHTLSAYGNLLLDDTYCGRTWKDENARWAIAREEQTIDEDLEVIQESKMRRLRREWSPIYSTDELLFLDTFYNQIIATQNVSTPILHNYARDLCEIELRIKKGLREGVDIKKDMDARDNIIRMAHFEASNARNAADFESIGELMVYYGKLGWHPNWHIEPQDSIDFMMQNIQNYLKRLVVNEGNFSEQVESKREKYNMLERLEAIENEKVEVDSGEIEYEGDDELAAELSGDSNE